jgi:hydroxyacylglutathione hydrolase
MSDEYEIDTFDIVSMILGPAMTNAYLVSERDSTDAVAIDPAWDGNTIASEAQARGWRIREIWITHGHFDHFGGVAGICQAVGETIPIAMHPADKPLWQAQGGAAVFGFQHFDPGPPPDFKLEHGMNLSLGSIEFEVRHTPGHTPGHIIFVSQEARLVFCGDLIFPGSVGRTDLPGGDWNTLLHSIQNEVLVLPDDFQLYSGHGPVTTVGVERASNPFLQ